jgi:hypothetical protein
MLQLPVYENIVCTHQIDPHDSSIITKNMSLYVHNPGLMTSLLHTVYIVHTAIYLL